MTIEEDLAQIQEAMDECGCKTVEKKGWFWNILHFIVMVVTFGTNRRFKQDYITTLGPWIGVNERYSTMEPLHKAELLRHEFQHTLQCVNMSLFFPIIPALLTWLIQGDVNVATNVFFGAFFVMCILFILSPKSCAVLGLPIMGVMYVLLPLPIGLAYFRWRFERAAYLKGMLVIARHNDKKLPISYVNNAVKQLTTGLYGWTWPFPKNARKWFDAALKCNKVTVELEVVK